MISEGSRREDSDKELEGDFEFELPEKAIPITAAPKVGRNDPCPCGSGKKHKRCCLRGE
ncbi:MAG: SEC-C domain-containing protein [Planctomycetes bacterium]|nr:SEC-C domain-containing protein [Planctomycetota bacterium]